MRKEEIFQRLNLSKINLEWRTVLRQIKCEQLQKDILQIEQFFKVALEQKNRIINNLLKHLDISENMYMTSLQDNMEHIKNIMGTNLYPILIQ